MKEAVKDFDIWPQIGTTYDKEDINNANWFEAGAGSYQYPQPEDDFAYLKATYNLDNYCSTCGIGNIQNAPFRLQSEPKQFNNQFWGLHWVFDAIFLRQEAKNILEKENISAVSFSKPLLHRKKTEVQSLFQLHVDTILEKGFNSYNTQIITCKYMNEEDVNVGPAAQNSIDDPFCGRVKYNIPERGGITFDKKIFDDMPDIAKSNEWFGSGALAFQLIFFSKKVKDIIEKNKFKGIYFTPIFHHPFE